jgi:hypothetical protein
MADKFEIRFMVDEDINTIEDMALLKSAMDKATDACDCGAKGVVICQIFTNEYGMACVEGKFVNHDIASKIVKLTKAAK